MNFEKKLRPPVLAVDDHPSNRDLLARQIELLGLRVETAESGELALSMWRTGRFALVITDCYMPCMDGYELAQAIRQVEAEEGRLRTPIIAWTANALAEEAKHCHAAGMDDVLVKPADEMLVKPSNLAQLRNTLAKHLVIEEVGSPQHLFPVDAAMSAQSVGFINYAVLNEIVPDKAAQIQILRDFQSHIRADRTKLEEVLKQADQVNTERAAHRMTGSCRMVGAIQLAKTCSAIEQAARDGDMTRAKEKMTTLDEAIQQFEALLIEIGKFEEKRNGGTNAGQ